MSAPDFQNLRVLAFESRRRAEIAAIVEAYHGVPVSAPAMREVPLESNAEAFALVERLVRGDFDLFVTLTGVGLRAVLEIAARSVGRDTFVAALAGMRVAARGPKPLAVLRELGVTPWVIAPSPNTWRELLGAIDERSPEGLKATRIAVQEYGTTSLGLLDGLRVRGALVTPVPVYQYALPEDLGPLMQAIAALAAGEIDVVLFTTATQVTHLLQVADSSGAGDAVREGLSSAVVASIGPSTSEALQDRGLTFDIEASTPKMGVLVREAAEQAPARLAALRSRR